MIVSRNKTNYQTTMITKDILISQITQQIKTNFNPSALKVIDDTDKHKKHKHFQQGKYHFQLFVNSDKLNQLSRVKAHQAIYNCLQQQMKHIHALSITLQKDNTTQGALNE